MGNIENSSAVDSRGFNVSKSNLTKTVIASIKKELTLVPVSTFGNFESKEIKVFQETSTDLTVPLYYAREHVVLRDFTENVQYPRVESVSFPPQSFSLREGVQTECYNRCLLEKEKSVGGGILNIGTGLGKCLGFDTGIVLNDGTVKKVQNIVSGDVLLGEGTTPCTVISTTIGKDALFKISYADGHFVCNSEHVLCIKNDIKILESPEEGVAYGVSYFCPVSNRVKLDMCETLRTAVLKKNFLQDILGVFDISLNDYIFSKCRLPMYRRSEPVNHWKSNGKSLDECYTTGKSLNAESINKIRIGTLEERKKIIEGIRRGMSRSIWNFSSLLNTTLLFLQVSLGR
jgi:hypothetical protein